MSVCFRINCLPFNSNTSVNNGKCYSEISGECPCLSEDPLNVLLALCAANSSLELTGSTCAMVDEILAGSSSHRLNIPCNSTDTMKFSLKDHGHKKRDTTITVVDFHHLAVPLLCPLIIFPGYRALSLFVCSLLPSPMKVPIYSIQLLACSICSEPLFMSTE